jgi:hypothetical protein
MAPRAAQTEDAILACAFPDDAPAGLLAVFKAYFDESGVQPSKPIIAVGCVVLRPENARRLSTWWRKRLKKAGVGEFKAADCTEGTGEFKNWSQTVRDRFRMEFAAKLDKAAVYAMAISVVRKEFNEVVYPITAVDSDFRDPYLWAMRSCLEGIGKSRLRKSHRLACVFDEGYGRWPQAYEHFQRVRVVQRLESVFFETFTTVSSIKTPCVQAADLIAYELRHWCERHELGVPKRFSHLNDAFQTLNVACGVIRADGLRRILEETAARQRMEVRANWEAWRSCLEE